MVSVALYILDSGEKQMLEDRAICDEYAEKNGYEIKKVFSEPLIQGMDNYGKRLGFLTFIGELQELGVEYVIVPSPKHLKGFDIAAYEAFFASTGAEMLFIEERKTKNGAAINDYGRKAAQRVTKKKRKSVQVKNLPINQKFVRSAHPISIGTQWKIRKLSRLIILIGTISQPLNTLNMCQVNYLLIRKQK